MDLKKKTDKLLDLISQQADTDEFYLYAEDPYEANIDSKAFIECSNNIDDIYKSRGDNNFKKKCKILIVLEEEYLRFLLLLLYKLISQCQKILD